MDHELLNQQLRYLGLSEEQSPGEESWKHFLAAVRAFYIEADKKESDLQTAFHALKEEMESSYELLRRSSNDLIEREREKFAAVIKSLGEGLCAINTNGGLLFINSEGERLLGWTEEELSEQLILDWVMPSGEVETTTERLLAAVREGESYEKRSATFIRESGRHLPVSYRLNPIMRGGKFAGAVLVFRDISDFQAAERERERQLEETLLLNRVIEAATSKLEVTAILEVICSELARHLNLPQAACAVFNEEQTHLTIVAEYLEEGRVSAMGAPIPLNNNPATQQVIRTKRPLVIEDAQNDPRQAALHEIARRRGTKSLIVVPLLVRDQVLGTLGLNATEKRKFSKEEVNLAQSVASAASQALANAQLYAAVQQELAERRRAEEALEQARDKALEASRLKTELIAKVSHELRTPLTSIIGFTEMLQLGIYGDVSADQNNILQNIMQSTDDLVLLVNDLLDLAQLEAGTLKLQIEAFKPAELIGRVESNLQTWANAKKLRLTTKIDPALPPVLNGDPHRLGQILTNLVNNAVKFTAEGEIFAKLKRVNASHWAIEVSDTGPGIPEEMRQSVFDEFRQVDYSTTRNHKGVGLGLSIVKQITNAMGGTVKLNSKVNVGSTFTVTLPLSTPPTPHR